MNKNEIKSKLLSFEFFKDIPSESIDWLIENAEVFHFEDGDKAFLPGDPIDYMQIILKGKLVFRAEQNGQYKTFGEVDEGNISGVLPFSRLKEVNSEGHIVGEFEALSLHRNRFRELVKGHYEFTERLVHHMSSRVREFTSMQLQNEKMVALGKLSAGLAHELNNPASAAARSAVELKKHLANTPESFKKVISIKLTDEQVDKVNDLLFEKARKGAVKNLSLMERNEREDAIIDFLEENDIDDADCFAENLVDFNFTEEDLQFVKEQVSQEYLEPVIQWLNNVLTTDRFVDEIEKSAERISNLVKSVKAYTHMDKAPEKSPADIHEGIDNTLTILAHKMKYKKIEVIKDYDSELPLVNCHVNELNQVWTNILDNAIDAIENEGTIKIKTYKDREFARIDISDTGVGIPEEIKNKIFDPFFTTKDIGKGTGLGLDIVLRIINNHNGIIKVDSERGNTKFAICIPIDN